MGLVMKKTTIFIFAIINFAVFHFALAESSIRAVGSSTVYPFITVVAEEFGRNTNFKTPIIESTGTGGGFKLFCAGVGGNYPDISNASRAIKTSEKDLCKNNGISNIKEIKIGYDGIVLANKADANQLDITREQLFNALARKVVKEGKLVDNPYIMWSDIDAALPAKKIEVYGPPPTSGTRDAFVELVLEKVCTQIPEFKAAYNDKNELKKACHLVREDGVYIDTGENDNLIVQKLINNENAYGIFGYSFLEENEGNVQGSKIEGAVPTFESIASGSYTISRPLFVYVKGEHINTKASLKAFVEELVDDRTIGEEGYLTQKGLIPLQPEFLQAIQKAVKG